MGNYDVATLQPEAADSLNAWLTANGFITLPTTDHGIVEDYIQQGWRFVTAKLHSQEEGLRRPHPIAITFSSNIPVYPMRLTGSIGKELHLEVFVVSSEAHNHPHLTTEVCDRFRRQQINTFFGDKYTGYVGDHFNQRLGHPEAKNRLWKNCIITRLSNTLTPSQMQEDLVLNTCSFQPIRKNYYSYKAAAIKGLNST